MVREPRDRRHNWSARLVAALLLVGTCAVASGQVLTELSDRTLAVGERLTYTVTIDYEEPADVTTGEVEFEGLTLIDGPTVRPVTILGESDRARRSATRLRPLRRVDSFCHRRRLTWPARSTTRPNG